MGLNYHAAPHNEIDSLTPAPAFLIPCERSAVLNNNSQTAIRNLENRLGLYQTESSYYKALEERLQTTKARFRNLQSSAAMCGSSNGLPRADASGTILPAIAFIYITATLGSTAIAYALESNAQDLNAGEGEII